MNVPVHLDPLASILQDKFIFHFYFVFLLSLFIISAQKLLSESWLMINPIKSADSCWSRLSNNKPV